MTEMLLQVYETELEKVPEFKKFRDFCQPFKLSRGKNADEIETSIAGEFKVRICYLLITYSCFHLKTLYLLAYWRFSCLYFAAETGAIGELLFVYPAWWSSCSASSKDDSESPTVWTSRMRCQSLHYQSVRLAAAWSRWLGTFGFVVLLDLFAHPRLTT